MADIDELKEQIEKKKKAWAKASKEEKKKLDAEIEKLQDERIKMERELEI